MDAVADLHAKAFPGFFLTSLGKKFLKRYYASILEDASAVFLLEDVGDLIGFVCGLKNPAAFNSNFVK